MPDGWLCANMIEAALCLRASFTTSRGIDTGLGQCPLESLVNGYNSILGIEKQADEYLVVFLAQQQPQVIAY